MLKIIPYVYYVFALALIGGGAMGSQVSGKSSSLLGSLAFGAGAVAAGLISHGNPRVGLIIGAIDALAVAAFFIYRYMQTGKPMPAFASIGLAVIVLILTTIAYMSLTKPATTT